MITTADGYRFTLTPFSPLMTEITGEIIPVTDGTASERVPRMENIAYLTEMAREIGYWARPEPYTKAAPNWVLPYDCDDRRLEKTILGEISSTAKNDFAVDYNKSLAYGDYCGVIPTDWTCPMTFPIVRTGSGAFDAMVATMVLARCSTGVIPDVPETDSLRRAYYDFGQMRRFLLSSYDPNLTNPKWADYVEAMRASGDGFLHYHLTGPMVQSDGSSTVTEYGQSSTIHGYVSPMMAQEWDSSESTTYTKTVSANLCELVNIYYYRSGLTTGTPYLANSLNGWVVVSGEYRVRGGSNVIYTAVFPTTFSFASTVGRTSPFYGRGQAFYNTPIGTQIPQLFTQVNSWLSSNVPNWSQREWLSVKLQSIYVDSGVLTLPSEIASSGWNWTP